MVTIIQFKNFHFVKSEGNLHIERVCFQISGTLNGMGKNKLNSKKGLKHCEE